MIPILSGNLSVDLLLQRQTGGAPLPPDTPEREVEAFVGLNISALEDYIAWALVEQRPGSFDFSYHRRNLDACRRHGFRYVAYPWLHVVPEWILADPGFTGFRCLEHDRECAWPSIFAPRTLEWMERLYAALAENLGGGLDALCVAVPTDYGEVAYPTGLADWVARLTPPRDHVHDGFWAGDRFAREKFRIDLLQRWESLARVNEALETRFSSETDIIYPTAGSGVGLRLYFAEFYLQSMADFVDRALAIARRYFPRIPISVKVGHGSELLCYGIDPTLIARAAAKHGATLRTTQASLPGLHQKRASAPCRFYGVPFASEPPADIGREKILRRIFLDAASGVREYFDYPEHLVGSFDLIEQHGSLLSGAQPSLDVSVLFATTDHRLETTQGLPPVLLDLSEEMRDRFDYEVVDEALVEDGVLQSMKVLALVEAACIRSTAGSEILRWVKAGGWLVVGPECFLERGEGELAAVLRESPDLSGSVEVGGESQPCMAIRMGESGDLLLLAGDWHRREGASQFRGTIPIGEWSRWSMARASAYFPVRPDTRYLLEIDGWVHPLTAHRRHDVLVNGNKVGRLARQGLQRFAAWVPEAALEGGAVAEVRLECDTFKLRDLNAGDDSRELGAAVIWIRLTEKGAPAVEIEHAVTPRLRGQLKSGQDLESLGTSVGAGLILVSRQRPPLAFLTLLEEAVRERSECEREIRKSLGGERPPFVQCTLFGDSVLLWNRGDRDQPLNGSGMREAVLRPGSLLSLRHSRIGQARME